MARYRDIPQHLLAYGLKVEEHGNWKTHVVPGDFEPSGVLIHHTATKRPPTGPPPTHPTLNHIIKGRIGLRGPLSVIYIDRAAVCHLISSGRTNHAGRGDGWKGQTPDGAAVHIPKNQGNTHFFGIEIENDGVGEPWDPKVLEAAAKATAALLDMIGGHHSMVAGHKEYTRRKIDPANVDMNRFRAGVKALQNQRRTMTQATQTQTMPKGSVVSKDHKLATQTIDGIEPTDGETRNAQVMLKTRGLYPGKIDGVWGPITDRAARAFTVLVASGQIQMATEDEPVLRTALAEARDTNKQHESTIAGLQQRLQEAATDAAQARTEANRATQDAQNRGPAMTANDLAKVQAYDALARAAWQVRGLFATVPIQDDPPMPPETAETTENAGTQAALKSLFDW